jgi:lipoate-protein ligase A
MQHSERPAVRWIPSHTLPGDWQMAIDEQLLNTALDKPDVGAVLRLYRWSRPTLSLGYHQRSLPPHWQELAAAGEIDLVRRPSGGRAVLHAGDITYALVWPAPPGSRRAVYGRACGWLCRAFAELGLPLRFGRSSPSRDRASCFATSTAADLVHANGAKRIGSAQLWRRGSLLQHGSILLSPPAALWQAIFAENPPDLQPLPLAGAQLDQLLRRNAERCLPFARGGVHLVSQELGAPEWLAIAATLPHYRPLAGSRPMPAAQERDAPGSS